jgi:hypothetical protein
MPSFDSDSHGNSLLPSAPINCYGQSRRGFFPLLSPSLQKERKRNMLRAGVLLPASRGNCTMSALGQFAYRLLFWLVLHQSASLAERAEEELANKLVELKNGDRIIFFGDSLTNLAGEEKPKEHVTKGYVRIVRETLREKHRDKNIELEWVATGGRTVPDLRKRVDKDVIARGNAGEIQVMRG